MGNSLGYYVPEFYAQEALIQLEKSLGMANSVHRGYDAERRSFGKGEKINIKRPSVFSAANAPGAAADVTTDSIQITLAYWKEVRFALTDKELAFSEKYIIEQHIRPAAYALADDIDQKLAALYKDVPWIYDLNATPGSVVTDVTGPRKQLFDNKVPMDPMALFFMVDGSMEAGLLANSAFGQWQGAGPTGERTQVSGAMGQRFGLNFFANQNVQTHVPGVCADATGAIDLGAGYLKGVQTIHIDGVTDGGTWQPGDTFVIAGNTQRYTVTALVTFTGGEGDVSFTPPLAANVADDAVVTGTLVAATPQVMAYHRNAFALAFAELPYELPNELGAKVVAVTDPVTNLSLRSRLYYDGDNSKVVVVLDCLYGVKTLDGNLAVRGY